MELIVWSDSRQAVLGFQLCYDKLREQRAVTWRAADGYTHDRVDDGELSGRHKQTPILIPAEGFDPGPVVAEFLARSWKIDKRIARFVYRRLMAYGD